MVESHGAATARKDGEAKKLRVLVTSLDGNLTHPFDASDTIGDVHQFAYAHLLRQKDQIPFERTWLELNGQRQEEATVLASLAPHAASGPSPDLSLALVWDTAGGRA